MVTLSAMRTSYDALDNPNDMPRTTSRSTNGQIIGAGDAHLRRISCAGKIMGLASSRLILRATFAMWQVRTSPLGK